MMQPADNAFFDAYKRLDKLCSNMYQCQNGVSEYIEDMERKMSQGQSRVSSWRLDYNRLKHVRWVRNKLAHESNEYQLSEPEDLIFVQEYYNRIVSGQDALALYRKVYGNQKGGTSQPGRPTNSHSNSYPSHRPYGKSRNRRTYRPRLRWKSRFFLTVGVWVLILLTLYFNR